MLIDTVQNKQTNKLSHLFRKYFKGILSYRFINLILILFIETTKLIKLLMVQPSISVFCERSIYMLRIFRTWLMSQIHNKK